MLTHIPLIKENVSGTTKEESCSMDHNLEDVSDSLMDPNNVAENLSDTLQLCEPFCFTDINSSKSSVVPDMLETNVLVGSFDSISIAEPSELRDNVAKDNATLDSVSEIQSHQNLSRRQSDSGKKIETEKAVRNCRGTSSKKPDLDLLLLKTNRKSRTSPSIRSRSSAWGWGNFAQLLEQNEGIDVNKSERKKSRKPKGSRGHGKQSKTQKNQSLKQLNGEINSNYSTTRIRLKVKMGKQVIQSCVPGTGNDIDKYPQTKLEFPKLTNSVGGRLEDEVALNTEFQFCYEDVDKDFTEHINGICSRDEVERFGVTVDNRCLDPGTSPDSEVVNQIPEASISRKLPEDLGNSASFLEQEEKTGDRSYSSEASISDITGVLMETLPSNLKLESPLSGIGVDSSESSEKISSTIPKGRKIPKSSTSKGNGGRQKGNQAKLVNKQKIKEKADGDKIDCKIDCVAKTGNYKLDDCAETKTGFGSTAFDASSLDMVPSGLMSRHVSQRNAWVRCDDCYKWRRIAAVLADSIEETDCKWICKDNKDTYFADCSIPQEKSNSEINAELEISDASCEEDACDARLNSNKLGQKKSKVPQNSSWKLIKSNIFLHRNRKAQTIDEVMVCHCKAPLNGRMGCGDGCLNRLLNIECVKGTCPCGEVCSNQQFQKRKYALLESFRCGKKGHGLRLLEDIPKGGFLIEYVGEVLDTHAYEARQKEYALKGHKHFYFMTLNGSEVIDACAKGNLGRFINHSCEPNCRTEKWMVNGEVCVGLFAMRDIKKGEEVTFDYNYVRVFGAAAKKCVCNSSLCRGYIGGDPDNAELIVQGDSDEEYPEPVMICEDGENNKDKIDKTPAVIQHSEIEIPKVAPKPKILLEDKSQSDDFTESEDMKRESSYAAFEHENPMEIEEGLGGLIPCSIRPIEDSERSESTSISVAEQSISSCTVQRLENSSLDTMIDKSLPDTVDIRKSLKSERELDRCIVSKSHARTKTSRSSSSSVKKGKSKNPASNSNKTPEVDSKSNVVVAYKPKKLFEGSSNSTFEAVQVKLNELLDAEGGISRRKDASRGYLKLLFLTAASGDTGNGETIQSTRDLSMILDAILKTKSRSVLVDVINKNGLQMLHNIMKRYRREFKKIPVLRKLLKILEYLASKEILTLEHINRAPPCAGVESFRESILTLTEHTDRQVHQIARKFRDTFIPRSMRKLNCMERDFGRNMEPHQNSNNSRFSAPHNHQSSDQTPKPTTDPIVEPVKQIPTDNNNNNNLSSSTTTSCTTTLNNTPPKTRKRKSRWDQPAESKEPRIKSEPDTSQNLNPTPMDEDVPPGFSPSVSNNDAGPTLEVVMGELQESLISELPVTYGVPLSIGVPQEKFISRLPVSYGIPLSVVQQFGSPNKEVLGDWDVAPGTPFQPFPPLPLHPREKRDPPAENSKGTHHSDPVTPSTSGAGPADFESRGRNNQQSFQRAPLGRKYFRQQKWNNNNNTNNNSKFLPPWVRNRIGTGFMGNNSRNGVCNVGGEIQHHQQPPPFAPQLPPPQGQYGSGEGFVGMEGSENCFYPPPLMPPPMPPQPYHHHQQNWHY